MGDVIKRDFGGVAEVAEHGDRHDACRHMKTVVNELQRTLGCAVCGAPLDPITVLLEYARKERHWRCWMRTVDEAQEKLKELQAEERRVKARMKNASRKDAAIAVEEERVRTERMRIEITEKARDIGQACRRIEQIVNRRTL